jgi:hypothetical protein
LAKACIAPELAVLQIATYGPIADIGLLGDDRSMENPHRHRASNWVRRIGIFCLLVGFGAMAVYGRTPLAAFTVLGGVIVSVEPYLLRRRNYR